MSLRLLLSHQSGTSQSSYWGFVPGPRPLPSVVDVLSGQPAAETRPVVVNRLPGTGFQYSGGGYLVAQLALTDATGQDFTTLTKALLFRPLKMRTAILPSPCRLRCNHTPPRPTPKTTGLRAFPTRIRSWPRPASTPHPPTWPASLSKCSRPIAAGAKSLRSARTMLTPQTEVSNGTYREEMGLGAFLLQRADHTNEAATSSTWA